MRFARFLAVIAMILPGAAMAQRSIDFADGANAGDGLIIAVTEATLPENAKPYFDDAEEADLARAITAARFEPAPGAVASFVTGDAAHPVVHLIGVKPEGMTARDWQDFGGRAATLAATSATETLAVIGAGMDVDSAALGAELGGYRFDKYKSEPAPGGGALKFVASNAAAARAAYTARSAHLARAVKWARDMQSEPANVLYPEEFVRRARELLAGAPNVSIDVLDVSDMRRLGMGAIIGVGQGSPRPPRMMIARYNGAGAGQPVVFAGKGITFDSGGVSIKPNSGMWAMKADMTGAAVAMASLSSLAHSRAPVNVVAIAALAENMPDGGAQRPGDVVKTASGVTVEIMSTDAEGRLVLSDALWYAQREFNPAALIDVATLTGSVGSALGDEYAGVFSRHDEVADALIAAGAASGDDLWRLPLHPNHFVQIKSQIADIKNADTGAPGASTGAAFLATFVSEDMAWAHLDIAGVDWRSEPTATMPVGASGFGVRMLDTYARQRQAP